MKKILFILWALLLPVFAGADEVEIDGIYYKLYDGSNIARVTVSPNSYSGSVVIPSTINYQGINYSVTSIGMCAFSGCSALTSITIPNSVTSIEESAFSGCSALTFITIPNSVTSIGGSAFSDCSALTSITIPNSVTSIWEGTFRNCPALASIKVETGNPTYDSRNNCNAIIETGTNELVVGCKKTVIPNNVTNIGGSAFSGCSALTSITIPNSVTNIGGSAFSECSALTSITIPNSVTSIGESAFSGCSALTSITIPNSVTTIGDGAFGFCSNLTSFAIPKGISSIGNYTFSGCSALTSITIPNSVTTIGVNSFMNCTSLPTIAIPNSVTAIGDGAFYGCINLTSVYVKVRTPANISFFGFSTNRIFSNMSNATLYVPVGCVPAYKATYPWFYFREIKEFYQDILKLDGVYYCLNNDEIKWAGVMAMPDGEKCSGEVVIRSSVFADGENYPVTSVDDKAFYECEDLKSITIPNSVSSIGSDAFSYCRLQNVFVKRNMPPHKKEGTFSKQTYIHAMLYVPSGSWADYAYDNEWYQFVNIREVATSEDELAEQQAYMMMDTKTFEYSVYDPVNECIGTLGSVVRINEDNPNHSWQVIKAGGLYYLYNLGVKKYVFNGLKGWDLSDLPTPIEMKDGENGIILGGKDSQQWALVSNMSMNNDKAIITTITPLLPKQATNNCYYDLSGRKLQTAQKGMNIIDGRIVLVK